MATGPDASGAAQAPTASRPRRIGVLGGTFDPPHVGHLVAALDVRHHLDLDVVLLVVANEPWQKVGQRSITPAADRLAMVRAAVRDEPGLEASDLEVRRGGLTYTVDTLEELRSLEPGAQLFLILGADAAALLPTWREPERVISMCTVVVVDRPGSRPPEDEAGFVHVEVPRLDVSSTDLRARAGDGRSMRYLVPDGVASLIRRGDLYGERR